mmetsp:Transcript_90331/g.251010  ORF Transcript_90331/g.251010 Transcript_90331/m.251010 type:complete len:285 (-) Transcript_90331:293-1147(-)
MGAGDCGNSEQSEMLECPFWGADGGALLPNLILRGENSDGHTKLLLQGEHALPSAGESTRESAQTGSALQTSFRLPSRLRSCPPKTSTDPLGNVTTPGSMRGGQRAASAGSSQPTPPSVEHQTSLSAAFAAKPPSNRTLPLGNVATPWPRRGGHGAASRSCSQVRPPSPERQTSLSRQLLEPKPPRSSVAPSGRAAKPNQQRLLHGAASASRSQPAPPSRDLQTSLSSPAFRPRPPASSNAPLLVSPGGNGATPWPTRASHGAAAVRQRQLRPSSSESQMSLRS